MRKEFVRIRRCRHEAEKREVRLLNTILELHREDITALEMVEGTLRRVNDSNQEHGVNQTASRGLLGSTTQGRVSEANATCDAQLFPPVLRLIGRRSRRSELPEMREHKCEQGATSTAPTPLENIDPSSLVRSAEATPAPSYLGATFLNLATTASSAFRFVQQKTTPPSTYLE